MSGTPEHASAKELLGSGEMGTGGEAVTDGGVMVPESVSDRTEATLHTTLTMETDTATVWGLGDYVGEDITNVPNILVSDEYGQPMSTQMPQSPAPLAPRVTEAILQTQTRRRAQLQQQSQAHTHSSSSIPLATGSASLGAGGEPQLPVPVQRQVKGRFKSSPLAPISPRAAEDRDEIGEEIGADNKDKVANSDPNLKEAKDGL